MTWEVGVLDAVDQDWDRFSTAQLYLAGPLRWFGAEIAKLPTDLLMYQEILWETRPQVILETGTFCGGSARYLQTLLSALGEGQVITIDVGQHPDLVPTPGVTYSVGTSSVDPGLVATLAEMTRGQRTMAILDSNHSREHVLRELDAYAPLVSPGHYLIVEDTHFQTNGPDQALAEWLPQHPEFTVDRTRERYGPTLNRGGYLRKAAE